MRYLTAYAGAINQIHNIDAYFCVISVENHRLVFPKYLNGAKAAPVSSKGAVKASQAAIFFRVTAFSHLF